MRSGIVLILVGAWVFSRTIFGDDQGQTIVGRIIDGRNVKPDGRQLQQTAGAPAATAATTAEEAGASIMAAAQAQASGSNVPAARRRRPSGRTPKTKTGP